MQTLGLAESTPRSDHWLKSLLWPDVENNTDVDLLGSQGYWVCAIISLLVLTFTILAGQPIVGIVIFMFFYLSGVGVRERSLYAATAVCLVYLLWMLLVLGIGVLSVVGAALLLANIRGTWLSSRWRNDAEEALLPPRLNRTWLDKFVDQLPSWLWPKVRIPYYIFSGVCVAFTLLATMSALLMRLRH